MTLTVPFPYFGGKTRIAPWIVSQLPAHGHYVEPFAGSLAVLLAKPPAPFETVNDLNGRLVGFWRVLRERPQELIHACVNTPHSRAELLNAYDDVETDELERARRTWVCLTQARAAGLRRTGWRHYQSPSGQLNMPRYLMAYVERMESVAQRLHHVSLECRPALELIEAYGRHDNVLIYADPPYLGDVRGSRGYSVEMPREAEHIELLRALRRCRSAVVLSGYASELYDDALSGWHRTERSAFSQGDAATRKRVEVLWSNRIEAEQLTLGGSA